MVTKPAFLTFLNMRSNTLPQSVTVARLQSTSPLSLRFDAEARRIRHGIQAARLKTDSYIERLTMEKFEQPARVGVRRAITGHSAGKPRN
ncbi:MAG: hypothetical protein EBY17_10860 [Acidobacteriia bacterium]|nr:hypothetical protein [Terriglobia bacterium]